MKRLLSLLVAALLCFSGALVGWLGFTESGLVAIATPAAGSPLPLRRVSRTSRVPPASATISMNLFNGRFQQATPALRSIADYPFRAGNQQNSDWTEQGLAPVRDMDEVALRIRYTF